MPKPVDVKVGEAIRQFRVERKFSQKDLATSLGISYAQVQKYESGKNRVSASRMVQIANILDIDVDSLFQGAKMIPANPINDNFLPNDLLSKQGLELLKAFHAIQNPFVKAKLLLLVKTVASEEVVLNLSSEGGDIGF